ncbi:glycoside hydrolase family 76 protein [Desertivirga arenae]|uniref:glycoside hydrolase family 76 protein n=1 Tax=Desertivirga arenae TaxID=2810309 RepID=UPI001A972EB1|nr:glycoside hydrolase family 76 protein [Pedobacter sp. SYSU D00823]
MKKILSILGLATIMASCGKIEDEYIASNAIYPINWAAAADSSSSALTNVFWNSTRNHFNNDNLGAIAQFDYWPEAHGLDVMVDAYNRTKSETYKQKISDFYEGVKAKNGGRFYNNYYDDMGWHGMAHLRALEATGDIRYEQSAKQLWQFIIDGWDEQGGGGIPWNHENTPEGRGKGVPSNGPAAIIAARRWQKYGESEVINGHNNLYWLSKIYGWIKENRVIPQSGRVFEKLNDKNGDWTYNAGTYIGAAVEYYKITKNKVYLNDAIKTADWATSTLVNTSNKVMSDWAEQPDHDVNLFKGILVRYLTQLILLDDLPESTRKRYVNFLKHNAEVLWTKGTSKNPVILFNYHWWEAPGTKAGLRAELSGSMLMEAMALLDQKGYLN